MMKNTYALNLHKYGFRNCKICSSKCQMNGNDLCRSCAESVAEKKRCRICDSSGTFVTDSGYVTEVCDNHLDVEMDTMYILYNRKTNSNFQIKGENRLLRREISELKRRKRNHDQIMGEQEIFELKKKVKELESKNQLAHELLSLYMK